MVARKREFDPEVGADRAVDGNVIDFYEWIKSLTDRQIDAGRELCRLYTLGFGHPTVTSSFDSRGVEIPSDEDDEQQTGARATYCRLMEAVPRPCQRVIARMVRHQFPDEHLGVTRLQEGLDRLADEMRLAR